MGGDISINVTIVGAQSTGKSTIVYKYTGRNYLHSHIHAAEMQTMTTVHSVKHNNKLYELSIRDICGSSVTDITSNNLCSNVDAIVICFDIYESSTFEVAKQWITEITQNKQMYPILLLIGTTKYREDVLSQHAITKHSEAEQCAKHKNMHYQTVCLSQSLDIQNIFTTIIDAFRTPVIKVEDKQNSTPCQHAEIKKPEPPKLVKPAHAEIEQQETVKITTIKPFQRDPEALKIKIILLGDAGVGKTTLRRRLEINNFDSNVLPTIGVDCSCFMTIKKYRDYNIEILLMDPSGQEIFKNITKQYYRGVHGVLLMCDITDIESWKNIHFWIKQAKENCCDDVDMILFCNKMDLLYDNRSTGEGIIDNVKLYAEMFNIKTYNISCKMGEYIKYMKKGFEELVGHIIYDTQLFERLKKEQGHELQRLSLQGNFGRSESFISVDGRAYGINRGPIKKTCNPCDY